MISAVRKLQLINKDHSNAKFKVSSNPLKTGP